MTHNKKQILACAVIVLVLTALCYACYHKPAEQTVPSVLVKNDSVVSAVLSVQVVGNAIHSIEPENAVQDKPASAAAIPAAGGRAEQGKHTIMAPVTERTVSLHRIDFSGIYALPENVQANQVKQVFLDNKPSQYTITENGNLDVIESQLKSAITAVLK